MRFYLLCLITFVLFFTAGAYAFNPAIPITPARSVEVLESYSAADQLVEGLDVLKPKLQSVCKNLLDEQLKLQLTSDSWKLYSLYQMFQDQRLMTGKLLRVGTVTELARAIPTYTAYKAASSSLTSFANLKSGSLIIADKGTQCGPDPYSTLKGAYFLKCGDFLIGSGIVHTSQIKVSSCTSVRVLINSAL